MVFFRRMLECSYSSLVLSALLFCILVNRMVSNSINRVIYADDASLMEFVSRLSPSYLNFYCFGYLLVSFFYRTALNSKTDCREMCITFLQYCRFPPAPLLVGSSLIGNFSCYNLLGVHLRTNILTKKQHVTCKENPCK